MRRRKQLLLFAVILVGVVFPAQAGGRKKVAVVDFDAGRVGKSVRAIFGSDVEVGGPLAHLIRNYLALDGTYEVVEAERIEKTLAKKELAGINLTRPADLRTLGKALKADAVLAGYVRRFGRQGNRRRKNTGRAIVIVGVQLVEVKSGKVLERGERDAVSQWSQARLLAAPSAGRAGEFTGFSEGVDFSRPDFQATLLGEAVAGLAEKLSEMVLGVRDALGVKQFSITLAVSSVNDSEAVLNMGKGLGLKVGQKLLVRRIVGEKKDRKSGVVLDRDTRRVGVIEVVSIDEASTTARVLPGSEIKVGDEVRVVMD